MVSLHEAAEEFQKIIDILLEHPDDLKDWTVSNRSNQAISAGAKLVILVFKANVLKVKLVIWQLSEILKVKAK